MQGNTLRLKIDGVVSGGKATHYTVKSSSPLITINQNPNPAQREQPIVLKVSTTGSTNNVIISAHAPNNGSVAAKFFANILPKLRLPDFSTEAGAVAHLLLAESRSPNHPEYGDGEDVYRAMELMRKVLDNRLAAAKISEALRRYVACSTSGSDLRAIKYGGSTIAQFDGFDSKRNAPDTDQQNLINDIQTLANDGTNLFFKKSRTHADKAIKIASDIPPPSLTHRCYFGELQNHHLQRHTQN